jgi:2-oxo-4-hydroxy-4-carboxy-5-ureidoimidazoline decarboxylase
VLDTRSGKPAVGVTVELYELASDGERRPVASAITNSDGRTDAPLIGGQPLPIARYELLFHVADYFAASAVPQDDPPFLDVVPVEFSIAQPEGDYHVPLLVTPWSYAVYRGS